MKIPAPRRLLPALLALAVVIASSGALAPVGAQSGTELDADAADYGVYSPALLEAANAGGLTEEHGVQTYGAAGNPGFIIHYANNSSSSLEEWANASTERSVLHHDAESRWMLIAAPSGHVGTSRWYRTVGQHLTPKLAHQDYVEAVDVDRELTYSEPVSELENASSYEKPAGSWAVREVASENSFEQSGVAYAQEANTTTMQEARQHVAADSVSATGAGVSVAVIDTGLNYNSELYDRRVIAGKNTLTNDTANVTLDADGLANVSESDYSAIADGNAHGSFVGSQIGANSSNGSYDGVAPDAQLIIAKALSDEGDGSTASIARALSWSCEQGADVVSMSLGGYVPQPTIEEEISECYQEHGVSAVIIAVGNERQSARWVATPADLSADMPVIGVGATNGAQPANASSAYFSNVGPDPATDAEPTVAAPGMSVVTQYDRAGELTTAELSGTSMSTPVVSGAVVLALEADGSLQGQPVELRDRVERTASPVPNAGATEVGAGMVNASQLVSDTSPEEAQSEARGEPARGRDSANDALAGSLIRQLVHGET